MSEPEQELVLKEVQGPTAIGGGWRRFTDLLMLISITDFKKTYFDTALGYVWSVVRPLVLFAVLLFVFTQIFRVGSQAENYPVLLLFNIVLFGFFQEASTASVVSVVAQEGVVRKTQFPRLVIPLSTVLTTLFNLGVNFVVVVIFILCYGVGPYWTWLFFPVVLLAMIIITTATSVLLSALYVRFRDISIIWAVGVTVLFYGTPVLYPLDIVRTTHAQEIIMMNPFSPIFVQARKWFIDPSAPSAVEAAGDWLHLMPPLLIAIALVVISARFFRKESRRIAEDL